MKMVVMMEGVIQISFTRALRWAPLYLLKKVQMRNTFRLIRVARGFNIFECYGKFMRVKTPILQVFSVWLEQVHKGGNLY